jgi:hypothetical protein
MQDDTTNLTEPQSIYEKREAIQEYITKAWLFSRDVAGRYWSHFWCR